MADDFPDFVKFEGFAGQAWYHQHMREKRILRRAREFTPERLLEKGEQGVWYDPSDTTTLFQDSAGTTPVTASGQPVGLMLDKSGRGNHATQPTAASRPIYRRGDSRGVVNLLTWSEAFDNAAWGKNITITANAVYAPDGTLTADKLEDTSNAVDQDVSRALTVPAGIVTASVWLRADTPQTSRIQVRDGALAVNVSVVSVTTEWQRFSVSSINPSSVSGNGAIWVFPRDVAAETGHVYAWGAQLNPGPTALPYQRNDANLGGVATGASTDLHWLETDGVDDGMATGNINFTGTDKVSVFAGVRKLSDAAASILIEISANSNGNLGSFFLSAPQANGNASFGFKNRGISAPVGAGYDAVTYVAPTSRVLSCKFDLAGATKATVTMPRINGVLDQGEPDAGALSAGGNYGNYPLYLFRRGGDSLPFNGWFYGLAITGRRTTDAETVATERLLAAKSAVVIP